MAESGMAESGMAESGMAESGAVALLLLHGPDRAGLLARVESALAGGAIGAARHDSGAQVPAGGARLAIAAPPDELRSRLELAHGRLQTLQRSTLILRNRGIYLNLAAPSRPRLVFVVPGQGSQHPGMLGELWRVSPTVRGWLGALDAAFAQAGRPAPSRLLRTEAGAVTGRPPADSADGTPDAALFSMEQGAQLSTAAALAMIEVMGELGIRADALVGHSIGEHAAVLAGHTGLATGSMEAATRAALCAHLCRLGLLSVDLEEPEEPEGMAAVAAFDSRRLEAIATREALATREGGRLFVAMDNCPTQQVLAGQRGALEQVMRQITAAGGLFAMLPFVRAYHTPLFGRQARAMAAWYRSLGLTPAPRRGQGPPVYSCLTTQPIPTDAEGAAEVMGRQWIEQVNFRATIERLYGEGFDTFVEVGPDAKLTAFVEDILRGRPHLAVSMVGAAQTARRTGSPRDLEQIGQMLAALFAHGVAVDPVRYAALCAGQEACGLPSPAPPLNPTRREGGVLAQALAVHRGLLEEAQASLAVTGAQAALLNASGVHVPARRAQAWPLLGERVAFPAPDRLTATRRFSVAGDPLLADHSLGRRPGDVQGTVLPVLSFTTSLALCAEAGWRLLGHTNMAPVLLEEVHARRWLALDSPPAETADAGTLTLEIQAHRQGAGATVTLQPQGERQEQAGAAFAATVRPAPGALTLPPALRRADPSARPPRRWDAATFYDAYAFHGPAFRGLERVHSVGAGSAEATVRVTHLPGIDQAALLLDPALLDCAGQLVAFWLLEQGSRAPTFGIFPVRAARVTALPLSPACAPGSNLLCRCTVTLEAGGLTRADVAFLTEAGRVVATVEGLVQRLLEFPPALATRLFGGPLREVGIPFSQPVGDASGQVRRRIDGTTGALLQEGQGIWARLLARMVLRADERPGSLLDALAGKEAAQAWAQEHRSATPELAAIRLVSTQAGAEAGDACTALLPDRTALHVRLVHDTEGGVTATVEAVAQPLRAGYAGGERGE